MARLEKPDGLKQAREKFLGLSLESTRKSYYPQLQAQLSALRENEKRMRLLADSLPARISYVDANQCFQFVNLEYERAFGIQRDAIVGRHMRDVIGADNYANVERYVRSALSGRHVRFEGAFTGKAGGTVWLEASFVPVSEPGGDVVGFYDLTRDLTERKRNEEAQKQLEIKLQQAQKMESLGTLAGGIAHDFNNLLMGIQGNASLSMLDHQPGDPHYRQMKQIEEYVQRGVDLTRQLLGLAQGGKYEVKPTDLNDLIKSGAEMFGRTRKEIQIQQKLPMDLWPVDADRGQIEQVLLNLFINAWHAMPDGGDLVVEARNEFLDENDATPYAIAPGRYVRVSVADTGTGIEPAVRPMIFDPFFTTKGVGKGTGLGLASAYGIIKNHQGGIDVDSEPGRGSVFFFYLPASEKAVPKHQVKSERLEKGRETVLLVDDESIILEVGEKLLSKLGYTVITADSGQAALDIYENRARSIDLIILDLIMPHMNGGDTFDRLKAVNPDVRVLLSSGYSIDGLASGILKRGCRGFIQKPFTVNALSRKVRDILD
ncbi:hypothetical protein DSCA_28530 [Desulfosarcina alkanivorans]|uniref:histidine kinase n=1 Tax=Desulfosarcina alkanivorans TaxID=571177 RepID=A0A5K7YK84_9BACT|nr:response regulator [Desulfosarcina alkanivorans]BBO68923.1 hypothetical protein DSCA_28530 [Desulfosarcina alkanivorans]